MSTTQEIQGAGGCQGTDHGHHWLIESPNGPFSKGRCKICGVEREFKNSIQITSWESDGSHVNRNQALTSS
jgi:hypothetical protein